MGAVQQNHHFSWENKDLDNAVVLKLRAILWARCWARWQHRLHALRPNGLAGATPNAVAQQWRALCNRARDLQHPPTTPHKTALALDGHTQPPQGAPVLRVLTQRTRLNWRPGRKTSPSTTRTTKWPVRRGVYFDSCIPIPQPPIAPKAVPLSSSKKHLPSVDKPRRQSPVKPVRTPKSTDRHTYSAFMAHRTPPPPAPRRAL